MDFIRGINFAPFPRRGILGAESAKTSLEALIERTGAEHIILTPSGLQDTPQSETIDFSCGGTPADTELISFIKFAQSAGLKVILKPTVNCKDGTWRAFINFFDKDVVCEPKWSLWFDAHERFQLHYAKIAQETGCVMFIAGCEMVCSERREKEWRLLIKKIKDIYKGPVSYNTDKYQEDNVSWWDAVDVISSSGYYPSASWEAELNRIEKVVKHFKKPFFFAELGCMSTESSSKIPNSWKLEGGANPEEQAEWYREMFEAVQDHSWVEGFGLWSWAGALPYSEKDAAQDKSYELYAKPAETVIKNNFARNRE